MESDPPMLQYVSRQDHQLQSRKRRVWRFGAEQLLTLGGAVLSIAVFVGMFLLFNRSVASGIVGALTGALLLPLMATFVRLRQRFGGLRILTYLDQSARLNLPLPEFLRIAANSETKRPARQLRAISESLAHGITVGDALRSDVPELPKRVAWMLRAAEANGSLPAALARLSSETETQAKQLAERQSTFPLTYIALLSFVLIAGVGFVGVFVMPKIAQISNDFGVQSLPLTQVYRWIDPTTAEVSILVVFVLTTATLLGSIVSSAESLMGRFGKNYDPLRDRMIWHIPLIGRLTRDSNLADVCQTLADALRAHRTADQAINEAAQPHLNRVLVLRLERWKVLHASGQSFGRAAAAAGMPSLVSGLLPERAASDNFAAALEFLASHYRSRALRGRQWILSIVPTALTFVFGGAVLAFSYLVYTSLWRLMDATLPYKVGL